MTAQNDKETNMSDGFERTLAYLQFLEMLHRSLASRRDRAWLEAVSREIGPLAEPARSDALLAIGERDLATPPLPPERMQELFDEIRRGEISPTAAREEVWAAEPPERHRVRPTLFAEAYFALRGDLTRFLGFTVPECADWSKSIDWFLFWSRAAARLLLPGEQAGWRILSRDPQAIYDEFIGRCPRMPSELVPRAAGLTDPERELLRASRLDDLNGFSVEERPGVHFFLARYFGWTVRPLPAPEVAAAAP